VLVGRLPKVYRIPEAFIVLCTASVFLAFTLLSFLQQNVGVIYVGINVVVALLVVANALAGETGSFRSLRESQLPDALERATRKMSMDLKPVDWRKQVRMLLSRSSTDDTAVISVPLLMLFTNLVTEDDTVPLRCFLVKRAHSYFDPEPLGNRFERPDDMSIFLYYPKSLMISWWTSFPGLALCSARKTSLARGGEKGACRHGIFFAVNFGTVERFEKELRGLGMQFGCGLFAPGPWGDTEAVRTWVKFEANTTVDDLRRICAEVVEEARSRG